jgi:RHS repeat-associated protein
MLTKVTYTAGGDTADAGYAYNGNGQLTKLTDWIDNVDGLRYAYDAAGKLTKITDYDDSTLDYTYDAAGNVVTMDDYHGSVVTYTYTDAGRLSTITAPGSKVWDYDYNANGQPTQYSHPNGMTTVYGYDTRNRLTKIDHNDGANVLDGFTYALDKNGNISKTTYQDGAYWDYWYDDRHRLTKAERNDSGSTLLKRFTYTYSLADNMMTKVEYTPPSTTWTTVYSHTPGNEMTKSTLFGTDTHYGYDDWGRMISKWQNGGSSANYYWNYGDKLTKVSSSFSGEGTVEFDYGGDGKRRETVEGGTTKWYNWDRGWNVLNEEDGSATLTRTYVHDPVKPIGTILADLAGTNPATGTARYYYQDNIGSTRRLRDASKGSLGQYETNPYGGVYAESGAYITHKFTGHAWDDYADLYYAPYRYYAPNLARWLSRDPLGMVDGPNVYEYAVSSPVLRVDPFGQYWCLGSFLSWLARGLIFVDCYTKCPFEVHYERVLDERLVWVGPGRFDYKWVQDGFRTVTTVGGRSTDCARDCLRASLPQGWLELAGQAILSGACTINTLFKLYKSLRALTRNLEAVDAFDDLIQEGIITGMHM